MTERHSIESYGPCCCCRLNSSLNSADSIRSIKCPPHSSWLLSQSIHGPCCPLQGNHLRHKSNKFFFMFGNRATGKSVIKVAGSVQISRCSTYGLRPCPSKVSLFRKFISSQLTVVSVPKFVTWYRLLGSLRVPNLIKIDLIEFKL